MPPGRCQFTDDTERMAIIPGGMVNSRRAIMQAEKVLVERVGSFENADAFAFSGEIGGGGQSVVTGADHDSIEL